MKYVFKRIISGFVAFVFCCSAVYAANLDYTVSYGGGASDVIIKGTSANSKAGRSITLQVIKEGTELSNIDYSADSSAENVILYTRQTLTDADGNFDFTFNISQSGKHTLRISDNGETIDDTKKLNVSTDAALADALAKLSSAKGNPSGFDTVMNSESVIITGMKIIEILQVDIAEYDALKASSSFLNNLSSKEYQSYEEFKAQYALSKLLVDVSNASNGEEVKLLLESDPALVTFDTKNAGDIYNNYSDTEKTSILNALAGNCYTNADGLKNALYEAVIINEFSKADTYQTKFDAISLNNDYICLDLSKLSNLGTYIEGFKDELSKKDLSNISKIKSTYEEVYLKYLNLANSQGSKPGSGSSSFGGSSSLTTNVKVDSSLVSGNIQAFNDIYSVPWATEAIEALASKGVISGKQIGIFAPNDNITRAEFVKILVGAFGLAEANSNASFADVPRSHWAYKFIATASSNGIVNGIGNGMFGTDSNITRQDIAVLCYRLAASKGTQFTQSGEFADESVISVYAKEAASKLKGAGIINGKESNNFDPASFATRAEAAKIIYELMLYCQK